MARTAFDIEPREVVRKASEGVEDSMAKDWLWKDERGTWEMNAREILEMPGLEEKAQAAGLGREDVIEEAATVLRLRALEAVLSRRKKAQNPSGVTESELTKRLKF